VSKRERKKPRPRRVFTPEFRASAVRLVIEEERSTAEVCRDLDLTHSALTRWVQQARVDTGVGPIGALSTDEKSELARLRKENLRLRAERDILKKATAFFARESE